MQPKKPVQVIRRRPLARQSPYVGSMLVKGLLYDRETDKAGRIPTVHLATWAYLSEKT